MRVKHTPAAVAAAGVAACAGLCAAQVIAAPVTSHHHAADSSLTPLLSSPNLATAVIALAAAALFVGLRWHRLRDGPVRPHAFSPLAAVFIAAMILMLGAAGLSLASALGMIAAPDDGQALTLQQTARVAIIASVARMLGVAIYAIMLARAPRPNPDRRMRVAAAIGVGIAALLLTWPLVSLTIILAGRIMGVPTEDIAHDTLEQLGSAAGDWSFIALVISVVVLAPIIEEVIYRGLLQQAARQAGLAPWHAIIAVSAVFALAHAEVVRPYAMIGLFVLSLGFGWAYEKTGRLLAPVTMHVLFNAGNLVLARMLAA